MAKGRKSKPTAKKKLIGTWRKDRSLVDEFSPELLKTIPLPPAENDFDDESKLMWFRNLAAMKAVGMLTVVDLEMFYIYVVQNQTFREMTQDIKTEGHTIINDKGMPIVNPKVRIRNMASKDIIRIAAEYGFTPSSRTKIGTGTPNKNPEEKDQFPGIG